MPITEDYVAYGIILSGASKEIGEISIRANITSNPQDNSVTINNEWCGQIDKNRMDAEVS